MTRGRLGGRAGGLEDSAENGYVEMFVEQQFGYAGSEVVSTIWHTRVVMYRPEGVKRGLVQQEFPAIATATVVN